MSCGKEIICQFAKGVDENGNEFEQFIEMLGLIKDRILLKHIKGILQT